MSELNSESQPQGLSTKVRQPCLGQRLCATGLFLKFPAFNFRFLERFDLSQVAVIQGQSPPEEGLHGEDTVGKKL